MALTPSEIQTIDRLRQRWESQGRDDELLLRYYLGRQRLEQLGMAIPPSMRRFIVVSNWPRVVVDTIRSRQRMRSMMLAGEHTVNQPLLAARRATNLDAHLAMFGTDVLVYGRGFLSCGANESAPGMPLVRAESPRQMVAEVDIRTETMLAAARFYGVDERTGQSPTNVTLYLPDVTVWVARTNDGRWVEVDRDVHRLGRVPIVMHLNRRMSGEWAGQSEMSDIIPIADAAARSLTNLQFAQEAHGIPRMFMTGVAKGDFVDPQTGQPIPQFEAYFNAIHTLTKAEAKVGQLDASDLKNFETALNTYGSQASIITGFPSRYFGHFTSNPPNEASMKADEAQLVSRVEGMTDQLGVTLGWLGGLMWRFMTGEWLEGNAVTVDWFDASTATIAQREDALMKRRSAGVLSRQGYWDELGWSEPRKAKEQQYLDEEKSSDPILNAARSLTGGAGATAGGL